MGIDNMKIQNLIPIFICVGMGLLLIPGVVLGGLAYSDTETSVSCSGDWDSGSYFCNNTYDDDYCFAEGGSDYYTAGRVEAVNGKTASVVTNYSNAGGENRVGVIQTQMISGISGQYFNTSVPLSCLQTSIVSIKHTSIWSDHDVDVYCLNSTGWEFITTLTFDESICEIGFYKNESDDTDYPKYSNLIEPGYQYYSANRSYEFYSDWSDGSGISIVFLEYGGSNYTADVSGSTYNVTLNNLSIGSHAYRWFANDSVDKWNATGTQTYTLEEFIPETISVIEIDEAVILDINATGYILMVLFGSLMLIFIPGAIIIGWFSKR